MGIKPVALSGYDVCCADMAGISKALRKASHGDAVFGEPSRSVRGTWVQFHSSNRTAIQRNVTPWLTAVYNFWFLIARWKPFGALVRLLI